MKRTKLKYFSGLHQSNSVAEVLIAYFLDKNNISFEREVSFKGFVTPRGGDYRYDFYLPKKNILIEYDGKEYHKNNPNDWAKTKFAEINKIKLIRLDAKNYYSLEKDLVKLLK